MAKRPAGPGKTLNVANLSALGAERLAVLLIEVGSGDANWKRRLKLELAAEVGAADLALEIDKRLTALDQSRARVSWRKRPALVRDLQTQRGAIVDRLAALDARLGLDRLIAWFDLYPGLSARVADPKGELSAVFLDAADDLAALAVRTPNGDAAAPLAEALKTRSSEWSVWLGRAAPDLTPDLAHAIIAHFPGDTPLTGRIGLAVRRLADRAGDVDAWLRTIPVEDRHRPDVGGQIASRLAQAGRTEAARAALEAARPRPPRPSRWSARSDDPPRAEPSDIWESAEIDVLVSQGRAADALAARWAAFERTLSEPHLRALIAGLPDFEDVEALDRAFGVAARWVDPDRGLAFLMDWPALREAAAMATARAGDLRGLSDQTPLWISRLEGRYPAAALALVRARARTLARQGLADSDEVLALSAHAAALAEAAGVGSGLPPHADFIDELESLSRPNRHLWR